ncbi:MAG: cell envelope biogenesis protein OmpA [Vicingaceae bacterium]|nr:MAG: cell envelope biogenesis protein OmpA [Vicingaceae bacterium]
MQREELRNWKNNSWWVVWLAFFLVTGNLVAQDECEKPNKKALKLYDASQLPGVTLSERKKLLLEALEKDPHIPEAWEDLANMAEREANGALSLMQVQQATNRKISYWKKLVENCPSYKNYLYYYELGNYYYMHREWTEAKEWFGKYLSSTSGKNRQLTEDAQNKVKQIEELDYFLKNPVKFTPKKVKGVCTELDEYLPMLSPDNRYLYFTRRVNEDTKSMLGKEQREFLTQSRRYGPDTFSVGIFMGPPFNEKGLNQGAVSISVTNKTIYVTVVELIPDPRRESRIQQGNSGVLYANGDIYYSEFKDGQWGPLKSIGDHINGKYTWEGQPSISADDKTLYFASAREGGYGGMDIYKVERQADGKWGPPVNLGPVINTEGNEKSPFIHSDSYTLYFSSDGHPGYGGFDIFYSKIKEDGTFTTPKNIGYPINTEKDEHGFIVSVDGNYGYFSAGLLQDNLDIYCFELYEDARPEKVTFIRGEMADAKGQVPDGVDVEIKNLSNGKTYSGVVDKESGQFVAVVTAKENEDLLLMAKKEGYAFSSALIHMKAEIVGRPIHVSHPLEVKPIEKGKTYTLHDILFPTNSYELDQKSYYVLDAFADFLKQNKDLKIEIQGHTDNVGDDDFNMALSENRARVVYEYLLKKGIPAERMTYKGYGETRPVASNATEEGRAKNRRTEFLIR